MIGVRKLAGLLSFAVILPSTPAVAHRLDVIVRIEDDLLVIEALYGEDLPVEGAIIEVRQNPSTTKDVDSAITHRGETDAKGRHVFRPLSGASLKIDVNDRHGHRRTLEVTAAELEPLFEATPRATIGTSGPKTTVLIDTREESGIGGWPTWLKILTGLVAVFAILAVLAKTVSRGARKR